MRSGRILVVDDEYLTRISLADFLREAGYETCIAGNGEAALQFQAKQPFDVCIVDIRMPGLDGIDTIVALHQLGPTSRFIVFTGSPQFTLPAALKKIGLSEHQVVRKPVQDMNIFVSLIEPQVTSQAGAEPDE